MEFVLDTGAHYTTIEYDHAIRLGLDRIEGEPETIVTEDGETDNIHIHYISMLFPTNVGVQKGKIIPSKEFDIS